MTHSVKKIGTLEIEPEAQRFDMRVYRIQKIGTALFIRTQSY